MNKTDEELQPHEFYTNELAGIQSSDISALKHALLEVGLCFFTTSHDIM